MTKFMDKSFSTYAPGDDSYRDNWEATFGRRTSEGPPIITVGGFGDGPLVDVPCPGDAQPEKWTECGKYGRAWGDAELSRCNRPENHHGPCGITELRRERDQPCGESTETKTGAYAPSGLTSTVPQPTPSAAPNACEACGAVGPLRNAVGAIVCQDPDACEARRRARRATPTPSAAARAPCTHWESENSTTCPQCRATPSSGKASAALHCLPDGNAPADTLDGVKVPDNRTDDKEKAPSSVPGAFCRKCGCLCDCYRCES